MRTPSAPLIKSGGAVEKLPLHEDGDEAEEGMHVSVVDDAAVG